MFQEALPATNGDESRAAAPGTSRFFQSANELEIRRGRKLNASFAIARQCVGRSLSATRNWRWDRRAAPTESR
jgi:hypothetical protein